MEIIKFAIENSFAFKAAGVVITSFSIIFSLAFPVRHKDTTLLGDGGVGMAVALMKQHGGLTAFLVYGVGAVGVALFFLPYLGELL